MVYFEIEIEGKMIQQQQQKKDVNRKKKQQQQQQQKIAVNKTNKQKNRHVLSEARTGYQAGNAKNNIFHHITRLC